MIPAIVKDVKNNTVSVFDYDYKFNPTCVISGFAINEESKTKIIDCLINDLCPEMEESDIIAYVENIFDEFNNMLASNRFRLRAHEIKKRKPYVNDYPWLYDEIGECKLEKGLV